MKAGLAGLIEQRKIGTEIFVTIATLVAVFDKTGTLTANSPRVVQISAIGSSFDDTALLRLAAAANRRSSHPLAKAVVAEALLRNIVVPEPDSFEQLQGRGVKAGVDGHTVLVGNAALLRDNGVTMEAAMEAAMEDGGRTPLHVAVDGRFVGVLLIADALRPGALAALATADVGIAMSAAGSQAALEAADIALMTDDLRKIAAARAIARRAYRTVLENLLVGVGVVHLLGITAALLGWIGPIEAAMIHLGPDVLVFLNCVKLLTVSIRGT